MSIGGVTKSNSSRLGPLWFLLKAGITLAIWYFLFSQDIGRQVLREFRSLNPLWALAAFLASCLQTFLAAERWRWVVRWLTDARLPIACYIGWSSTALLLGQVLPSTVGGDIFRVGALARAVGLKASFRTVLTDRAIGMLALAFLVIPTGLAFAIKTGLALASLVPLVIAFVGVVFGIFLTTVFLRLPFLHKAARPFRVLAQDLVAVLQMSRFADVAAISLAIHLLSVAVFVLLGAATNVTTDFYWRMMVVVPPALLVTTIPISLGGWGVREGAIVVGFTLLGKDPAIPLLLSLMFGVWNASAAIVGSLFWVTAPFVKVTPP